MKILVYVLAALVAFGGTLAGLMAATGLLNQEALGQVMGQTSAVEAPVARPVESLGAFAQQLRQKEAALLEKEQALKAKENQINLREQSLLRLRQDVETMQAEVLGAVEAAEADRQEKLVAVAITLAEMRAERAAQSLNGFTPEDQAAILNLVPKPKDRGKILEAMEQDQARRVLQAMQSPTL